MVEHRDTTVVDYVRVDAGCADLSLLQVRHRLPNESDDLNDQSEGKRNEEEIDHEEPEDALGPPRSLKAVDKRLLHLETAFDRVLVVLWSEGSERHAVGE